MPEYLRKKAQKIEFFFETLKRFDSYSVADVISKGNDLIASGVQTISIAFGLNNFFSTFVLQKLANEIEPNLFTAGSGTEVKNNECITFNPNKKR